MVEIETSQIDSAQLASAIMEIIQSYPSGEPILLSSLGQRLSARYGQPLRQILAEKRLSEVIDSSLGSIVKFEGEGTRRGVRLAESTGAVSKQIRYDPSFWAAFSKPIKEEARRFFKTSRPFNFSDHSGDENNPEYRIEIERHYIPDAAMAKPERDAAIRRSIDEWCKVHSLKPSDFLIKSVQVSSRPASAELKGESSTKNSLISFIEAIPESDRGRFSLSLDLIYHLITKE